jgi:hypothetical protein
VAQPPCLDRRDDKNHEKCSLEFRSAKHSTSAELRVFPGNWSIRVSSDPLINKETRREEDAIGRAGRPWRPGYLCKP